MDQSVTRLLPHTNLLNPLHVLDFGLNVALLHEFELVLLTVFEYLAGEPAIRPNCSAHVSLDVVHEVVDYFIEGAYFLQMVASFGLVWLTIFVLEFMQVASSVERIERVLL